MIYVFVSSFLNISLSYLTLSDFSLYSTWTEMLYEVFYVYWYFIFSIISITFLLVILRRSWGILPRLYVHGLISLQEKFSPVVSKEPPAGQRLKVIQKRHNGRFIDRITANYCHNERNKKETGLLELETELLQAGVEAIIQVIINFTKF